MRVVLCILSLILIASAASTAFALTTNAVERPNILVSLLSDVDKFSAGDTFRVGLKLVPDDEWHVYWRNPGDSGMPVSISWTLPEGVTAGDFHWPMPHKIPFGIFTNYGYENEVILPSTFKVAENFSGEAVEIVGHATWLVCREQCIPGDAEIRFSLPLAEKSVPADEAAQIAHYLEKEPKKLGLLSGSIEAGDKMTMELFAAIPAFKQAKHIEFFPVNESLFDASAEAKMFWKNNLVRITQNKSDSFMSMPENVGGVLVVDHKQAWEFSFDQPGK